MLLNDFHKWNVFSWLARFIAIANMGIRYQDIICAHRWNRGGWGLGYLALHFVGIRWRHQMQTFSALLALCVGNSPVTSELPSQKPVKRCFDFFYLRLVKNGWLNNRKAGDLRRHCSHYDVIVMYTKHPVLLKLFVFQEPDGKFIDTTFVLLDRNAIFFARPFSIACVGFM